MGTQTEKYGKPDVRQLILRFLKLRGQARVDEVARHLRIGHEGARKHLIQMEESGWVARRPEADPQGQGRPKDSYSVTASGDALFPKAYDRLTIAILEALRAEPAVKEPAVKEPAVKEPGGKMSGSKSGEGGKSANGAGRILAAMAKAQVEDWTPRLQGKSIKEKLDALKSLYQEDDPFTTVQADKKDFLLIERNCPFLNVAMEHPALCSLSVSTLEMLLGHPVVREERFQAGHGRCVFRIKAGEPAPKREFRFESGSSAAA